MQIRPFVGVPTLVSVSASLMGCSGEPPKPRESVAAHAPIAPPADYDGDGRADITVCHEATGQWFVQRSTGGVAVVSWGFGDWRVPADYDGDGVVEMGIYRTIDATWRTVP